MKRSRALMCLVVLLLLLPPAVSAVGNISVTSNPAGATVFMDGSSISGAVTPYTITGVANATHTILLRLSGYQDYTQTGIQVNDNQTSVVSATLVAIISSPAISSISPISGYNSSTINNVVITGSGFATSGTVARLYKSGQTNITGLVTSAAAGQLTCNFPITGAAGSWDVVVVNPDGGTVTSGSGFTIVDASAVATVTGITPSSGTTNTTVTITSLAGTGFQSTAQMRLTRTGYNDLTRFGQHRGFDIPCWHLQSHERGPGHLDCLCTLRWDEPRVWPGFHYLRHDIRGKWQYLLRVEPLRFQRLPGQYP